MKITNDGLSKSLWEFAQSYLALYRAEFNHSPLAMKDLDWPSPCQEVDFDKEKITWQPKYIQSKLSFENVERALEIELHTDIKDYYTTIFSDSLTVFCDEGNLSLLFAWSEADFERLQENIIGHIMMKKELKQSLTVFFAITDIEDSFLSINNVNGEVWVENVGCEPHKKIAESLSEFLTLISPKLS